ncbi:cupin domain-containing protein [Catellatospora sp. KI3]|uniref:cupin domain-containing protein n=1 Tax=Catellatospora sp. KI3 TaxID=3041620 RepID=UPI00248298A6|nr:cupin domain-containing protein [Catellatospora sp. KI3]MDI1462551.1 cupin domain-containing protein [Catellatospora sp. KI3]
MVLRRSSDGYLGRQGGFFFQGISAESCGSKRLCLHVLTIPPYSEGTPHVHAGHESGIYVVRGTHTVRYGHALEFSQVLTPGDMVYIPADLPHMPVTGAEEVVVVVARTDPNEQESLHLLASADLGGELPLSEFAGAR